MSSSADSSSTTVAPTRRRHDAQASREALLDAAGELFDERGYEAATVREIGERSGVDPALIARYFGGKEGLYLASLSRSDRPKVPGDPGEALAAMLTKSERAGIGPVPLAMVSPTLTDTVREQVRAIVRTRVLEPLADELAGRGVEDAELRAEVLLALAMGISLTRATGPLESLAETPLPRLLELLEPLVDALERAGD